MTLATVPSQTTSLDALHDIVEPAPIPWFPPAPGWWVLFAIAVVITCWISWSAWKRYRAMAFARAAHAELRAMRDAAANEAVLGVAGVIKRVAMHVYSRQRVAALSGQAWLAFLDAHGGPSGFPEANGRVLFAALYQNKPPSRDELLALIGAAEAWVAAQPAGHCVEGAKPC